MVLSIGKKKKIYEKGNTLSPIPEWQKKKKKAQGEGEKKNQTMLQNQIIFCHRLTVSLGEGKNIDLSTIFNNWSNSFPVLMYFILVSNNITQRKKFIGVFTFFTYKEF